MDRNKTATRTVLDGFEFGEGPRWHEGALWFSDLHGHRVVRTALDGTAQTVAHVTGDDPSGLGFLPSGEPIVVAMAGRRILRVGPHGELVVHADLSDVAVMLNDMVVGPDGTAYVGDMGYDVFAEQVPSDPGATWRVDPDGSVHLAAADLWAPNGHALSPDGRTLVVAESAGLRLTAFTVAADGSLTDRRTFAELEPEDPDVGVAPPDGCCLDAEGAVWFADPVGRRVVRVLDGGEVTDTVRLEGVVPVACVLGGPDRRTLLICAAAGWERSRVKGAHTGRIEAIEVDVPGAGWP